MLAPDLGGKLTTMEVTRAVSDAVRDQVAVAANDRFVAGFGDGRLHILQLLT